MTFSAFGHVSNTRSPLWLKVEAFAARREAAKAAAREAARAELQRANLALVRATRRRFRALDAKRELQWHRAALEESARSAGPRQILLEVSRKHNIPVDAILGQSRQRRIVLARGDAIWRFYSETRLSTPQIGARFGKDHSTILHGVPRPPHRLRIGEGVW
jgi:chromosomal replication initiation ATPase DnaA